MYKFRYDNAGDANQQLNHTVVIGDGGVPYYIKDALGEGGWIGSVKE